MTAGVREVSDGKGETYVSATKEIFNDIVNNEREKDQFFNSFSCFLTDRSVTEQKVNNILSQDISHDEQSFKCSVHPLLQFSEVCLEEIYH